MTPADRNDTSGLPEDQYEPGSNGTVLRNLIGIRPDCRHLIFLSWKAWGQD